LLHEGRHFGGFSYARKLGVELHPAKVSGKSASRNASNAGLDEFFGDSLVSTD